METEKMLKGLKTIANVMGVSISTVKRYRDVIPVTKMGGCIMIAPSKLRQWLNENEVIFKNCERHSIRGHVFPK